MFLKHFTRGNLVALSPWAYGDALLAMKGLLDMYMKNDGISIQFNIFSAENLRDAQAHPEKYKNLQVRVSGWNVLWNDLSFEEQEAYIKRAESIC